MDEAIRLSAEINALLSNIRNFLRYEDARGAEEQAHRLVRSCKELMSRFHRASETEARIIVVAGAAARWGADEIVELCYNVNDFDVEPMFPLMQEVLDILPQNFESQTLEHVWGVSE